MNDEIDDGTRPTRPGDFPDEPDQAWTVHPAIKAGRAPAAVLRTAVTEKGAQ